MTACILIQKKIAQLSFAFLMNMNILFLFLEDSFSMHIILIDIFLAVEPMIRVFSFVLTKI